MKPADCCNGKWIELGEYRKCECCRQASVSAMCGLWPAFAVLAVWLVLGWVLS